MPVYNGERYLREAIPERPGPHLPGLEFIIVDDGSTDDTREVIPSFPDPRIRLLENIRRPAGRGP